MCDARLYVSHASRVIFDSLSYKESYENKKRNSITAMGEAVKLKAKETTSKRTCFIVARKTTGRGIARVIWSPRRRRMHVMFHLLHENFSLKLMLFLTIRHGN